MLLSRKLHKIVRNVSSIEAEISRHESIGISSYIQRRIIERCAIQLQIEFELFVRNLILDSATGKYSRAGVIIRSNLTNSFKNRENACDFLVGSKKREPNWAIPKHAIDASNTLMLSNLAHISAELGVSPWEVDHLRYVRNFIAHRSKESALKLRSSSLASPKGSIDPVDIIVGASPMGGKNYVRWAGFIRGVATRLVA